MATSPEALLISAVLQTGDTKTLGQQAINEEMFGAYPDEFGFLSRYIDKHRRVPSKDSFTDRFPEFVIYQVDDVGHYCEEVRKAYAEASTTELLDEAIELMSQGRIDKALEHMGTNMLRVQATLQDQADDYDLAADYEGTYQALSRRVERVRTSGAAGIPTGFGSLDTWTGGWQPGWFCIVGGRLGAGKTWMMVKSAVTAAMSGYTALYYSLEQPRDQIAMRAHTMMSAAWWEETFRGMDLVRGTGFDLRSYKRFLGSIEDELPGRLVVNDARRGQVGPMAVAAGIEREEPDVVFVDYLTLLKMKGDGNYLSIGDLSASLQSIAQRYEVPLVVGSQLNRSAMGQEDPDAGMIGRGDTIGQDADLVLMNAKISDSVRKVTMAKFRHGPEGLKFHLRWKPNTGDIEEIDGTEADRLKNKDQEVD